MKIRDVQPGDGAAPPSTGQLPVQPVELVLSGLQRRLCLSAGGSQDHHRVHGKDLGGLHLRLSAAGRQASRQQQRRQQRAKTSHRQIPLVSCIFRKKSHNR